MRIRAAILTGAALLVTGASGAWAEARIYPYHASENFCPAGLQPVTKNGVICCGTPNQSVSYQSMMAHPAPKKKKVHRVVRRVQAVDCPIGTKGCS